MLIVTSSAPPVPLTIPRLLHQIWLGKKPVPARWKEFTARLIALHPEWEYRLWTDADLPALFADDIFGLAAHYGRCQNFGYQSDLVRLMILFQQGGVYLDTDCEPLRPLNALPAFCTAFVGATFSPQPIPGVLVENAVIGARPEHPFLIYAMQYLAHDLAEKSDALLRPGAIDVVWTTGPRFLSERLREYRRTPESIGADVAVLPAKSFYPVVPGGMELTEGQAPEDYPDSFLIHHWKGSWKTSDA